MKPQRKSQKTDTMATFSLQTVFLIHSDPLVYKKWQKNLSYGHWYWERWETVGERICVNLQREALLTPPKWWVREMECLHCISVCADPGYAKPKQCATMCSKSTELRVPLPLSGAEISKFTASSLPGFFLRWMPMFAFVSTCPTWSGE